MKAVVVVEVQVDCGDGLGMVAKTLYGSIPVYLSLPDDHIFIGDI
jgi:hypothetical protein